jgi:hypothetical protein
VPVAPVVQPTPAPSAAPAPTQPATGLGTVGTALVVIIVAAVVIALLGLWVRSRG